MKIFIIIFFLLLLGNNLLIAQKNYFFNFDKDTVELNDALTGYFFKLSNLKEKICFDRKTKFIFNLSDNDNYLFDANIISANKCTSKKKSNGKVFI
ncbi:hypothetical protein [Chryseobacterium proteolyticum]|uniref:hypothetical protein n=1 Tax=Chryseobacterium proteolyticum TaxID=118127 RepID=UPI0039831121